MSRGEIHGFDAYGKPVVEVIEITPAPRRPVVEVLKRWTPWFLWKKRWTPWFLWNVWHWLGLTNFRRIKGVDVDRASPTRGA